MADYSSLYGTSGGQWVKVDQAPTSESGKENVIQHLWGGVAPTGPNGSTFWLQDGKYYDRPGGTEIKDINPTFETPDGNTTSLWGGTPTFSPYAQPVQSGIMNGFSYDPSLDGVDFSKMPGLFDIGSPAYNMFSGLTNDLAQQQLARGDSGLTEFMNNYAVPLLQGGLLAGSGLFTGGAGALSGGADALGEAAAGGTGTLPSLTGGLSSGVDILGGASSPTVAGLSLSDPLAGLGLPASYSGGTLAGIAGGTALPSLEGITGLLSGGGGASAGLPSFSSNSSTLSKLLSGNATSDDYIKALGGLGSAALGYLGSEAQSNAASGVADKYLALGQPYREKLSASYAPGFSLGNEPGYQDAIDQTMQSYLRKASTGGNPFENPGVSNEALKYVTAGTALPQLNTYRSQLGSFGQLGVNTAGTADLGAASQAGGPYDALGYGLSQLTQPNNNQLQDLLSQYMRLNSGGGLA